GRGAVVIRERRELPAEVRDVGCAPARRTAAHVVEQRGVADHRACDPPDPERGELMDQLDGGWSVALLPHLVEGPVAERAIAAATQVEVPVPYACGVQMAGTEHGGVDPGAGAELGERRHARVELLDRSRRA